MVQKTVNNVGIVKRFKKKLQSHFKIDRIVFFGSRARGNFGEESDFDLILVSDDFEKMPLHKRGIKAYLEWKEKYPLELLCLTNKEFNEKRKNAWSIVFEALKNGVTV